MKGFFSPSAWQGQIMPLPLIPECGRCNLWKGCMSPKMKVSGQGRRKVLICAEAPGLEEDNRGIQLCGEAGIKLTQILHRIGINMRKDCWLLNALACRPPGNRTPTKDEIDYCRPNVTALIEELKPDVIIPLGTSACKSIIPLAWKDGGVDEMAKWRGRRVPSQKLNTYLCPTYHPSFLLRTKNKAAEFIVLKDLKAAFSLRGKPWPDGPPDYKKQIKLIYSFDDAASAVKGFQQRNQLIAIDLETEALKPDGPNGNIICCSISDGKVSICYPWHGVAIQATKELLLSDVPKTVANLRFESRFFLKHLKIFPRNWVWDTVLGAHVLNCTHGICSLKFQAFVRLGVGDYDSHIDPFKSSEDKGGNSANRMRELEFGQIGEYCAMDSLLEMLVTQDQMKESGFTEWL